MSKEVRRKLKNTMKQPARTIIEWTYTPKDYFETEVYENRGTYELKIADGKVTATFAGDAYSDVQALINSYHNEIRALFSGIQVVSHTPFTLSKYQLHRQHSDGKRDITVFPDSVVMKMTGGNVDFVVTDSSGKVISDSKAERIREKLEFAKLAAKHSKTDSTARLMLSSYEASVNDPANELIHLYQIRDALKKLFGRRKAPSHLGMVEAEWDRFDALCNNEPLNQGRHRGQHPDTLRDATAEELKDARHIAKQMIFAYLKYID